MSDISDKISKILEEPENIKMITEIAESLMGENAESREVEAKIAVQEKEAENIQQLSSSSQLNLSAVQNFLSQIANKEDIDNSIRLISALLPYMSKGKRGSAEYVIKILGAMKFLGSFNMNDLSKIISLMSK